MCVEGKPVLASQALDIPCVAADYRLHRSWSAYAADHLRASHHARSRNCHPELCRFMSVWVPVQCPDAVRL